MTDLSLVRKKLAGADTVPMQKELAGAGGVSRGPRNADEQVLWTCESGERPERKRRAGDPGTVSMQKELAVDAVQPEPVSGSIWPITGKNTGKNGKRDFSSPPMTQKPCIYRRFGAFFEYPITGNAFGDNREKRENNRENPLPG